MNDYAAAPAQPIVQGLITIQEGALGTLDPFFQGVGVSNIVRTPAGSVPAPLLAGDFILTLDVGLPGDVSLEDYKGRIMLTCRGGTLGPTTITEISDLYPAVPGLPGTQVRIITSAAGVGIDPTDADADGLEIIIWRGVEPSIPGFTRPPVFRV